MKSSTDRRSPGQDPDACPSSEALAEAFVGEAPEAQMRELTHHLLECDECTEVVQQLRSLEGWRPLPEVRPPVAAKERPGGMSLLALAAAVLTAAGLVSLFLEGRADRTDTSPGQLRSDSAGWRLSPADGAAIDVSQALILSASPSVDPASRGAGSAYRFVLFDAEANLIWRSDFGESSRIELPPALLAQLSDDQTYFWRVEERAGIDLRQSPLSSFVAQSQTQDLPNRVP